MHELWFTDQSDKNWQNKDTRIFTGQWQLKVHRSWSWWRSIGPFCFTSTEARWLIRDLAWHLVNITFIQCINKYWPNRFADLGNSQHHTGTRPFNNFVSLINRTDLGKCTHQCDETQRNNSIQALSTKIVLSGCKKWDGQQKKKEAKKRTEKKERLFLLACVSSRWWAQFPRSVLFCQPHQQLCTHSSDTSV